MSRHFANRIARQTRRRQGPRDLTIEQFLQITNYVVLIKDKYIALFLSPFRSTYKFIYPSPGSILRYLSSADKMLSSRGARCAAMSDIPWRYAPRQSYNKDTNPDGLISFALAENVCHIEITNNDDAEKKLHDFLTDMWYRDSRSPCGRRL